MKTPNAFALLFSVAALLGAAAPRAEADVSLSFFQESLAPHGEWIEVGDYGNCWKPNDVGADWSPYTDGYWAYTDAGWTWVSYEDFGSITYHYGRWVNVEDEGWCWTPGYEWGPAWVSWRNSEKRVGWAPLPPEAVFEAEVGISTWVDTSYDIAPSHYNFCEAEDFGAPTLLSVILPRSRNVNFIQETVNITNISYNDYNTVIYNGGPDYGWVNRRSHREVPTLKLVQNNNITNIVNNNTTIINKNGRNRGDLPRSVQRGNQLEVFAPRVTRNDQDRAIRAGGRKIPGTKVRRGLDEIKDPALRAELKEKLREENKGKTAKNAPARKVRPEELQVVPVKADPNAPIQDRTGKNRKNRNGRDEGATAATVPRDREGNEGGKLNRKERKAAKLENQGAPDAGVENAAVGADQTPGEKRGKNEKKGRNPGDIIAQPERVDPAVAGTPNSVDPVEQSGRAERKAEKKTAIAEQKATSREAEVEQTRREMDADKAARQARREQMEQAGERKAERKAAVGQDRSAEIEQRKAAREVNQAARQEAAHEQAAAARERRQQQQGVEQQRESRQQAQQRENQQQRREQQQQQQNRQQQQQNQQERMGQQQQRAAQQERASQAQQQRQSQIQEQRSAQMQQQRAAHQQQQQQRAEAQQQQRAAQMQNQQQQQQQQRAAQQQQRAAQQPQQQQRQGGGGGEGRRKGKKGQEEE